MWALAYRLLKGVEKAQPTMKSIKLLVAPIVFLLPAIGFAGDNGYTSYCGVPGSVARDEQALTVTISFKTAIRKVHAAGGDTVESQKKVTAVLKEKNFENLLRQETALSGFVETSRSLKKTPYVCVAAVIADDGEEIPYVSFSWTSVDAAEADLLKQF